MGVFKKMGYENIKRIRGLSVGSNLKNQVINPDMSYLFFGSLLPDKLTIIRHFK